MKFLDEDFLLASPSAKKLYHEYAEGLPIIDYHCHLSVEDIAKDTSFEDMTQLWLSGDHYKWTAMRSYGIEERYITGDATNEEKFKAWAEAMPFLIGNPLYHWSHLELKKYFGFDESLTGRNWKQAYDHCNSILRGGLTARKIIAASNVEVICSTDDPVDDLRWHKEILQDSSCKQKVYPAFRPDKAIIIESVHFPEYISRLSQASGIEIKSVADIMAALIKRLEYFVSLGCKVTDHGLTGIPYSDIDDRQAEEIFQKRMSGKVLSGCEFEKYQGYILQRLAKEYAKAGLVMQLHYGVVRDINHSLYGALGVDAGGDTIGGGNNTDRLIKLISKLDAGNVLPKTIIYSINPNDNAAIDTLIGCFQTDTSVHPCKLHHGAAWWFNDTKFGMEAHMKSLGELSCLSSFVGMLTDSRSLLSYTRHEYFRRILCNYLGGLVDTGEYPEDFEYLQQIIGKVCYSNAKKYFGF